MTMTMRIIPAIRLALKLDAVVAHTIKLNRVIAVTPVIVMHTMRALFQVAYRLAEETILHVIPRQITNHFYYLSNLDND
jgi:hypothetical protein